MKHFTTILLFALVLTSAFGTLQETIHRVEEAVENIKHQAQESLHMGTHKVQEGYQETANTVDETIEHGGNRAEEIGDKAKLKVGDAVDYAKDKLNLGPGGVQGGIDAAKRAAEEAGLNLEAGGHRVQEGAHAAGHSAQETYQETVNRVDETIERGQHTGEEIGHKAKHRIEETADRIREGVQDFVDNVKEGLHIGHKKTLGEKIKERLHGESSSSSSDSSDDDDKKGLKDRIKEGVEGLAAKKIKDKVKGDESSSSDSSDEEEKKGLKDRIKEGITLEKVKEKLKRNKDESSASSSDSSDTGDAEKKGLKDKIKEGIEHITEKIKSHKKDEGESSESSESTSSSDSDEKEKSGLGHKIKAGIAGMTLGKFGDKIADKIEPENNEGLINKARGVAADATHAYVKVTHLQEDVVKEGVGIAKDTLKEELHLSHDHKNVGDRAHEAYEKIKEDVIGIAEDVLDAASRLAGSSGQKVKDLGQHIHEGIDRVKHSVGGHGHHYEGGEVDELSSKPEDQFKDESARIARQRVHRDQSSVDDEFAEQSQALTDEEL